MKREAKEYFISLLKDAHIFTVDVRDFEENIDDDERFLFYINYHLYLIIKYIKITPKLLEIIPFKDAQLTPYQWCNVIIRNPELIEYYDYSKFKEYDWKCLLMHHPQFIKYKNKLNN